MRAPLKRLHTLACAVLVAASLLGIQTVHAALGNWANFGTVSMTDAIHPKLTNGYGCYTDGRDIVCDSANAAVSFGSGGLISYGGATVVGTVSASAISATYVSSTVLQINASSMPCSTGLNGAIRYSSTSNTLEVCTGTAWSTLSSNTAPGNLSGSGSATAIAYWNGANSLTYESSATSGLYWDHVNGRLGVGTNAPTSLLSVASTQNSVPSIQIINESNGIAAGVQMRLDAGSPTVGGQLIGYPSGVVANGETQPNALVVRSYSASTGGLVLAAGGNNPVRIFNGSKERLHVDPSGNIGIGTATPTATLQVSGSFTVSNSLQPATSPSLYVAVNGAVGIGTSSPNAMLEVGGSARVSDNLIMNGRGTISGGSHAFAMQLAAVSGLEFTGSSSHNNQMTLSPFGNLGISQTTPIAKLDVNGTISASDIIQVGQNNAIACTNGISGSIRYSVSNSALEFCQGTAWTPLTSGTITGGGVSGGSATAVAFWNGPSSLTYESATTSGLYWDHAHGRLGIGNNSPTSLLDVSSNVSDAAVFNLSGPGNGAYNAAALNLADTSSGKQWTISNRGSTDSSMQNHLMVFNFDGSTWRPRVTIDPSGSVGIGTQFPAASLQVSGTFTVSSSGAPTSPSLYVKDGGKVMIGMTSTPGAIDHPFSVAAANDATMGLFAIGNANTSATLRLVGTNSIGSTSQETKLVSYQPSGTTGGDTALDIRVRKNGEVFSSPGTVMTLLGGGKVGIGTSSPSTLLQVSGTATMSMANLVSQNTTNLTGEGGNRIVSGTSSVSVEKDSTITFVTGGTTRMSVGPTGRVSINNDHPDLGIFLTVGNALTHSTLISTSGFVVANGFAGRSGWDGALTHVFNIDWTGGAAHLWIDSTNLGAISVSSDRRLKKDIKYLQENSGLAVIERMKPVSFHWKDPKAGENLQYGFIAQDMRKVLPEVVVNTGMKTETTPDGMLRIEYNSLIAPMVKAIQELKADNDNLRADAQSLRKEVDDLHSELHNMKLKRKKE